MAAITKDDLIELQQDLGTDSAIGRKLGVTRQAIFQLRRKYQIPSIRHTPRNSKIIDEFKKGKKRQEIAQSFGLSYPHVAKIIRDYYN